MEATNSSMHTSQTSEPSAHNNEVGRVQQMKQLYDRKSHLHESEPKKDAVLGQDPPLAHHQIQCHLSPEGGNADSQEINFSFLDKIPQEEDVRENDGNSYRNKLKYVPNDNFLYDKSYPTLNKSSYNTNSIPNTFHYKSHPNAKTKSALAIVTTNASSSKSNSHDSLPQTLNEIQQKKSKIASPSVPLPPNLDVIIDGNDDDLNITPDWMPSELNQKWTIQNETDLNHINNFNSSVRITNSIQNNEFELNLPSTSDTMVHNSANKATTPMWQRAHKEYELNKKLQPHLQSIFMSQNSNTNNNDKSLDGARSSQGNKSNGSYTMSSTISTPLDTSEKVKATHHQHNPQPPSTVLNSNLPESPLKLFTTNYNTFTKGKLNGLLAKMSTKTDLTPRTEDAIINKVISNAPPAMILTASNNNNNSNNQLNGIKKFTERGQYTDKQFIDNADKVFKNLKRRGYSQNFRQVSNHQSGTSTSTPKNDKLVKDIIDYSNPELEMEELEYSSYTSGFETDSPGSGNSLIDLKQDQKQIDEVEAENSKLNDHTSHNFTYTTTNNDFTTFTKLASSSQGGGVPEIEREVDELQNEYTFDSFSEDAFTRELAAVENSQKYTPVVIDNNLQSLPSKAMSSPQKLQSSPKKLKETQARDLPLKSTKNELNLQMVSSPEYDVIKNQVLGLENGLGMLMKTVDLLLESKTTTPELPKKVNNDVINASENSILDESIGGESFDPNQTIKWKTGSQLQFQRLYGDQNLQQKPTIAKNLDQGRPLAPINGKNSDNQPLPRGVLKRTADIPVAYDNMVLDLENHKWVPNDDRELENGSLDSIEDLVSYSEEKNSTVLKRDNSFQKHARSKRNDSKLEVSFNLPAEDSSIRESDTTKNLPDVTLISRVDDVSFSQTVKKLVHAIAESLANVPTEWNDVTSLALLRAGLDSLKDLERFLPFVTSLDISHNSIRFLEGIPSKILQLKAESNNLGDLTVFSGFHDLQRLNISGNEFSSLSALSSNIHLAHLNASKNVISSIQTISNLENLVTLDLSSNNLTGDLDFIKFKLPNLQELNLSENKIKLVKGIENLPSLRILNLNENQVQSISCNESHLKLKKLLLKLNRIKNLDVSCYPFLRVLRIDGNMLTSLNGLDKLKNLDEVSCKSQYDTQVLEKILLECQDINILDISGNGDYDLGLVCNNPKSHRNIVFLNVNVLSLCAMDLKEIPLGFGKVFPNVRELNLNFNSLNKISELNELHHLKKLYLVSNSMVQVEGLIKGLINSRSTLEVLDVRLNPVNVELYPYVFNPHERDVIQISNTLRTSPIQLETLDDIENFVIHYQSLNKSELEWAERDSQFISQIAKEPTRVDQRINYEMVIVNFFNRLRKLDGSIVTHEMRHQLKHRFNRT